LREFLEDILPRNSFFDDFEVTHDFESIGSRTMLLNARRLNTGEQNAPERDSVRWFVGQIKKLENKGLGNALDNILGGQKKP
jgi:hypothetical protein